MVKDLLWPGETVEVTVKQRRIGPGGSPTNPTSVVATDKRMIIINTATMGIRKDYEVIPYRQITSVRLENGIISSSVFVRVQGYDRDQGLLKGGKEEGEIDGLSNKDAKMLSDYLNKKISETSEIIENPDTDSKPGAYKFCSKCGTKNDEGAAFCGKCGTKLS